MYTAAVSSLELCPFCKETFPQGEQGQCPHCEVNLIPASRVPPSVDAFDGDDEDEEPTLPWLHWGHGRGPLVVASLLGLVFFSLPWVNSFTPERAVYTGIDIAKRTTMAWGAGVAWFTLLPLVLSRRTIPTLRSARLAAAFLAIIPACVAGLLLSNPPGAIELRGLVVKVRFDWAIGLYLTLGLSLLAAPFAFLRLGKGE